MSHRVRVAGAAIEFDCAADQTVLEAAEAAGWELPYSCRRGACNTCLGKVVSGDVDAPPAQDGQVLFCQAKPRSALEIAPREILPGGPPARRSVAARIFRITRAADDVALIQLRFPAGIKVKFRAGQYLDVILDDGARRSFSMANPPQQSDGALLHARIVPGGRFSQEVLPSLAAGGTLRVELPFGDFFLRESSAPAVMVASGTGFAPIKAMLEDAWRRGVARPFALYWGARRLQDLYQLDLPVRWAEQQKNFRFVPVLSDALPDDGWSGRAGLVHRAVMEDYPTLAGCEVYACGVNAMVNAARRDFIGERALAPAAFFCDAFVTPADVAAATSNHAPAATSGRAA
jgi:NAD(P)H-flavin reductase/ferredoxin